MGRREKGAEFSLDSSRDRCPDLASSLLHPALRTSDGSCPKGITTAGATEAHSQPARTHCWHSSRSRIVQERKKARSSIRCRTHVAFLGDNKAILGDLFCGCRALFNIARMFGGKLPEERACLIAEEAAAIASPAVVLTFPTPHTPRRRAAVGSQQFVALGDNKLEEIGARYLGRRLAGSTIRVLRTKQCIFTTFEFHDHRPRYVH